MTTTTVFINELCARLLSAQPQQASQVTTRLVHTHLHLLHSHPSIFTRMSRTGFCSRRRRRRGLGLCRSLGVVTMISRYRNHYPPTIILSAHYTWTNSFPRARVNMSQVNVFKFIIIIIIIGRWTSSIVYPSVMYYWIRESVSYCAHYANMYQSSRQRCYRTELIIRIQLTFGGSQPPIDLLLIPRVDPIRSSTRWLIDVLIASNELITQFFIHSSDSSNILLPENNNNNSADPSGNPSILPLNH